MKETNCAPTFPQGLRGAAGPGQPWCRGRGSRVTVSGGEGGGAAARGVRPAPGRGRWEVTVIARVAGRPPRRDGKVPVVPAPLRDPRRARSAAGRAHLQKWGGDLRQGWGPGWVKRKKLFSSPALARGGSTSSRARATFPDLLPACLPSTPGPRGGRARPRPGRPCPGDRPPAAGRATLEPHGRCHPHPHPRAVRP